MALMLAEELNPVQPQGDAGTEAAQPILLDGKADHGVPAIRLQGHAADFQALAIKQRHPGRDLLTGRRLRHRRH